MVNYSKSFHLSDLENKAIQKIDLIIIILQLFYRSKNSQHVFYRVKNHSATPRGFKPDTPARFLNIT